jgi:hypothetical protein
LKKKFTLFGGWNKNLKKKSRDFLQAYVGFRRHFLRELQNISNAKYNF